MAVLWIVIILGIVEGVTEFLPISSTGHLILVGHWLNYHGTAADTFNVVIQSGAMLAVVWQYRDRFTALLPGIADDRKFSGWRGCWLLLLTTMPALVAGLIAHKWIKMYLFTPLTVAAGLLIGGVALVLLERKDMVPGSRTLDDIGPRQALCVGLWQCLALWPGVSRSAATIIGGMMLGMERRLAAEYSFFAAVPVLVAAGVFDLYKNWHALGGSDVAWLLVGGATAFLTALVAIRFFLQLLSRYTLACFGYYRIVIATVVLCLMWAC